MSAPRVSIVTATYNWSAVLRCAIESVRAQTFTDFEMLVIGDGCTDDSGDVVASFGDRRIHWHNLPANSGHQSAPNNAGNARARGEFVAYLGHDDLWAPRHLADLVAALDRSRADVAYSWAALVFPPPSPLRVVSGLSLSGEFEPGLQVPPSSLMHRRDLLGAIGGWQDYRTIREDPEVNLLRRAFAVGKKFVAVPSLSVFKFNSAYRRNSYIEKPFHEQAEYLRRMRAEPDFLERELADIIRSNICRHPEDVLVPPAAKDDSLGENVARSRVLRGLDRPAARPIWRAPFVPARMEANSSAADDFFADGWAAPEAGHRWNDGKRAAVIFRIREVQPLQVRIALAPFFGAGRIARQTMRIAVNGAAFAEHHLVEEGAAVIEMTLPVEFLQTENRLEFEFPDALSPAALGLSTDLRQLAIALHWMELTPPVSA